MIIWEEKLDDLYNCKVTRISEYKGKLTMVDPFDRILLDEEVDLMYGAVFGPDISDVALWQDKCIEFIDKQVEG